MKFLETILEKGAFEPRRAHKSDAGMDLKSPCMVKIPAHGSATIDTGVHVNIPFGKVGILLPKSGLMTKHDILTFGVIDSGYEGSIIVKAFNLGNEDYDVFVGDKITQLIIFNCHLCEAIFVKAFTRHFSERGTGGFGSTGR